MGYWIEYAGSIDNDSSITWCYIGGWYISVEFKNVSQQTNANYFRYSESDNGKSVIDYMKTLAEAKEGLNEYINRNRPIYESTALVGR